MRFRLRPRAMMPTHRRMIVLCLGALALAACTSHAQPKPTSGSSGSTSNGAGSALAGLRHQAELAAGRSFTATYAAKGVDEHGNATSSTMRVFRTPSAARIDIAEGSTTVRILVTSQGTFSCTTGAGATPLCVELAGAEQSLSPSLSTTLQLELLFTSAPSRVAEGAGLKVGFAPARTATSGAPAASCFAIISAPSGSEIAPGTYCYANGLLVSADFRTGSLELRSYGDAPADTDFTLPASPVPLPKTTPSRTPTAAATPS